MQKISFKELTLSKEMHKAIDELGFEEATPIQSEAIPVILEGKDVIGQAQTGTGKTAAFAVPAIEKIDAHDTNVQVLILCPTRELALQVAEETKKLTKYKKGVYLIPLYGGQSYDRQFQALRKGVQIVIGTPGRIMDHIERGTLILEGVKTVVLDEADVMLDMGFREDIEKILQSTPDSRQTLLFSATMPKAILDLTRRYQKSPSHIRITHESVTVPAIEQVYFEVKQREKLEALANVIDLHNLKLALVFANTKRQVDELVENLQARGYLADGMHGDMKQNVREKVLAKFKKGRIEILVATDVAARGIDVENVDAVFNFDMPQDEESYVHRIGRTGRAGASGKAFSFVTGKEILRLKDIERFIKMRIKRERLPSYEDIDAIRANNFFDEIRAVIGKGNLEEYFVMVEKLTEDDFTSLDVAAALLKMKIESEKKKPVNDFFSDRHDSDYDDRDRDRGRDRDRDRDGGKRKKDRNADKGKKQDRRHSDNEDQARIFLNMGKKDKMRPGDILGAITGETGVSGRLIGDIDMYDAYSYVDVPADIAEVIIDALDGITMRKKKIHAELAKPKG
jgi:ATP-dependent RNA helicase DeaD